MRLFAQKTKRPRQDDVEFDAPLRRNSSMQANIRSFAGGAPATGPAVSGASGIPRFAQSRVALHGKLTIGAPGGAYEEEKDRAAPAQAPDIAETVDEILVNDQDPGVGAGAPIAADSPSTAAKKKAGVESFEVRWTKDPDSGPTRARLLLEFTAKFKKDDTYDPALAEFRQNAFHVLKITSGPNQGTNDDNSPIHDDGYSRADDMGGNKKTDINFSGNDNPGATRLDKDDVLDYTFTAEQMIIDTSDNDKVIAKKGPHTATITGKDPRTFGGVPTTL